MNLELNKELVAKIQRRLDEAEKQSDKNREFYEKYKAKLSKEEKDELIAEQTKLVEEIKLMREERDSYIAAYKKYKETESIDDYSALLLVQSELMKKYDVKEQKVEVVTVREPKKKNGKGVIAVILAAAIGLGAGFGLRGCSNNKESEITRTQIEEPAQTPVPTPVDGLIIETPVPTAVPTPAPTDEVEAAIDEVVEELPFETYGSYTNPLDETQLEARAHWIYTTYIEGQEGVNKVSEADIINVMRMASGQFKLDDYGNPGFNEMDLPTLSNKFHVTANYNSLTQMGYNLKYSPIAPYFPDGSLEQKGALIIDNIMYKLVEAIRNQDDAAFYSAAQEYGTAVLNMFKHVDYTGEYPNVYAMQPYAQPLFYHAVRAPYASTINEYQQRRHIDVCIPYCYDNTIPEDSEDNVMQEIPLSELMYELEEVPFDQVAARSGHLAEYQENNPTTVENLFMAGQIYFKSKAELELGFGRGLN